MSVQEDEFESWCYRNGGETYGHEGEHGIVCEFPDSDADDRVGFAPNTSAFQVITEGRFYLTTSIHQTTESWIDVEDRLHIDTDDVRVVVDPS